jgi:kynurenine formamidase
MELRLLSHVMSAGGPVYPGDPTLSVEPKASIAGGDVANTFLLHLFNHFGTHVDGPRHFNPEGITLAEVPVERFVFVSVGLLDIPKEADELITAEEIAEALPAGERCDLLMIRTGFEKHRGAEPEFYAGHMPGLSIGAAKAIVDEMPWVGAIALDTISAGPIAHPEDGVGAHRTLCGYGRGDGRFVLIYEDVSMAGLKIAPVRVWGIPLLVEGLDSAPVTMVAEV